MNLRAYLERNGERISRTHPELLGLARRLKLSPETLYMVALEHKRLGIRSTLELVDALEGVVPRSTLRPDVWPADETALGAAAAGSR